jgi:excisionase family DNA binding protein
MTMNTVPAGKAFLTVREAADILRVNPVTLYRAIREEAFPAVRIRTRYVVPAKAIEQLIDQVVTTGQMVDLAELVADRRRAREIERVAPEWR